jgi:hypothetical protein
MGLGSTGMIVSVGAASVQLDNKINTNRKKRVLFINFKTPLLHR